MDEFDRWFLVVYTTYLVASIPGLLWPEEIVSEVEVNSDDWTAVHQCAGFDGHHGLSILDGAQL